MIRYTLLCLQFSKDYGLCHCFFVHALQNNFTDAYRPLKTNIHSASFIPILKIATKFHFLGDSYKNTDFSKSNFQVVFKMRQFANLKPTLKLDNPGQNYWDDFQKSTRSTPPPPPPPAPCSVVILLCLCTVRMISLKIHH